MHSQINQTDEVDIIILVSVRSGVFVIIYDKCLMADKSGDFKDSYECLPDEDHGLVHNITMETISMCISCF